MQPTAQARALIPLLMFLILFFGSGLYFTLNGDEMGFYKLHAPVLILPAILLALWMGQMQLQRQPATPTEKTPLDHLLNGMGEANIMLMCLIFFMAGAFAKVTQHIGGIDAAVYLGLSALPASFLLPGIFIATSLISLAMGTSMGTIAAVAPIALGLAEAVDLNIPLTMGTVIGGAMFGDNLSIISDTTIAATRTQGAQMHDKFKENFKFSLPAALITAVVLWMLTSSTQEPELTEAAIIFAAPYLVVLILALLGVHVLAALTTGIVLSGALGIVAVENYTLVTLADDVWLGFQPMVEITILSILIGGLAALMREQGGLIWLTQKIKRMGGRHSGPRTGEASVAALSALANVFVANNTVSILVAGPVAKELADSYQISPKRSASLLDIFSCVVQGLLPYGAQVLLAASLAQISPLAITGNTFYCWLLGGITLVALLVRWPNSKTALPQH